MWVWYTNICVFKSVFYLHGQWHIQYLCVCVCVHVGMGESTKFTKEHSFIFSYTMPNFGYTWKIEYWHKYGTSEFHSRLVLACLWQTWLLMKERFGCRIQYIELAKDAFFHIKAPFEYSTARGTPVNQALNCLWSSPLEQLARGSEGIKIYWHS